MPSRVISSTAGTRTEPKDGYKFVRGTTARFKIQFLSDGVSVLPDVGSTPVAKILAPKFLSDGDNPIPNLIDTIEGTLVPGQEFEYEFVWDIPGNQTPLDNYIVSYQATLGGQEFNFGDEYFTIVASSGAIGIKDPGYATVSDIRMHKFNIDQYLPETVRKDQETRDLLIENHIRAASIRLREELNLNKARGMSENYRLFVVFYTIWSIMLASRGEDGSAVSDQNLMFWRSEWERILAQEKREGVLQGIPLGRG